MTKLLTLPDHACGPAKSWYTEEYDFPDSESAWCACEEPRWLLWLVELLFPMKTYDRTEKASDDAIDEWEEELGTQSWKILLSIEQMKRQNLWRADAIKSVIPYAEVEKRLHKYLKKQASFQESGWHQLQ